MEQLICPDKNHSLSPSSCPHTPPLKHPTLRKIYRLFLPMGPPT